MVPTNTCRLLTILGVPEEHLHEIKVGDQLTLGIFQVAVLQAEHGLVLGRFFATGSLAPNLHPPLRMRDYRMDTCFSFLIELDGLRFLDWSSEKIHLAPLADVLFIKPLQKPAYYEITAGYSAATSCHPNSLGRLHASLVTATPTHAKTTTSGLSAIGTCRFDRVPSNDQAHCPQNASIPP